MKDSMQYNMYSGNMYVFLCNPVTSKSFNDSTEKKNKQITPTLSDSWINKSAYIQRSTCAER